MSMTFSDFTRRHCCTNDEKDALAWHLAQLRARQIYQALRPSPQYVRGRIAP